MPSRFTSGAFDPELAAVMGKALQDAWAGFQPQPQNEDFAKYVMAGAIIESAKLGLRERDILILKAKAALAAALQTDPEALSHASPDSESPHAAGADEAAGTFHADSNDQWPEADA